MYAIACSIAVIGMAVLLQQPSSSTEFFLPGRMLSVHLMMELVAIVVASLVVAVSLHSPGTGTDAQATARFMACGFIVVVVVDVFHALTYSGMPAFLTESSTPQAVFFWLAGRTVEVATLGAIAFGAVPRMSKSIALVVGITVAIGVVWFGSYHLNAFPTTFEPGRGVTSFKFGFELSLCAANLVVALRLRSLAKQTGTERLNLLALSCFIMGVGELAFTSYRAPSDIQNILGHLYKVAAYSLMYASTFVPSIRMPYDALRESEVSRRETEQRMHNLGDHLANTVLFHYFTDSEGSTPQYVQFSSGLKPMHGLEPADVVQNPDLLISQVLPEDLPLLQAGRRRAVQSMTPNEAVIRFRVPGGSIRQMLVVWSPRRTEDGRIAIEGVETDITERVESDAARRTLEAQLQESQKLEALGAMSSGIVHDFNNILGSIIGNAALAEDAKRSGNDADFDLSMSLVRKSASRARELVRQILTFSRRRPLRLDTQPMKPIVEEALSLLKVSLPAKVTLDCRINAPRIQVRADATQMQQVLLNLCTNAWQAMGSEGGHIQVTLDEALLGGEMAALNDLRPGKYAVVEVKDNGCGMDEQTRRRIFEPLFTTKAENSGTGLGLAVAHGIARAHEGAILVESKQGVGTTFRVAIPAVEVDLADEPAPMSAAPATKAALGVRVLYIDDDAVMCLTVGRLLERNGFIVKCEEDPAAAIATLKSEPRAFDVVVSDFNMPRHSGLDVLREALAVRPDMPTILTSGNISAELEEQAEHLGVRRLLEKQFTFEQLCPAIAAVAGSSASTRPQNLTAPTT